METATHICVYAGTSHPQLASDIADFIGIPLGKVNVTRFPDGEIHVKFGEHVRSADVFIVQPTCTPTNETLMELLIMIDAAKRSSAARITAVLPFYGYARQDRKDQPRVPITAKLVANLITVAGADRIISVDLHSQQIQGFFDIPVDHLYARPVLVPVLREITGGKDEDLVIVAPDSGSAKMGMQYGDLLHAGFAVVAKRRLSGDSVACSHLVGEVEGKTCIITDDMTSTCGTLAAAAEILKTRGAKKIYAAVTHCMLNEQGKARLLSSPIEQLITTNTIPQKDDLGGRIKVVSMAPLLGEAIQRIHDGKSVSTLFYVRD